MTTPAQTGAITPFEVFFDGEFKALLAAVKDVPGTLSGGRSLAEASWDRKAAWLLWRSRDSAPVLPTADELEDLFG